MFDIWLTESTKLVQKIIEESNLKQVVESVIKDFMGSEKFADHIEKVVETQVIKAIEEYAEYYMISDNGFEDISKQIKDIIVENAKKSNDFEVISPPRHGSKSGRDDYCELIKRI